VVQCHQYLAVLSIARNRAQISLVNAVNATDPVTSYVGLFAIVVVLYGLRAMLYRWVPNPRHIAVGMSLGLALAVPVVWLFSGDPKGEHQVSIIGRWVFAPVCWLMVLSLSCLLDLLRGWYDLHHWYIRFPLEILIGIPVWTFLWGWICIILNWISV
jgi:hypothetical protein